MNSILDRCDVNGFIIKDEWAATTTTTKNKCQAFNFIEAGRRRNKSICSFQAKNHLKKKIRWIRRISIKIGTQMQFVNIFIDTNILFNFTFKISFPHAMPAYILSHTA